jgi:hypothetical protein
LAALFAFVTVYLYIANRFFCQSVLDGTCTFLRLTGIERRAQQTQTKLFDTIKTAGICQYGIETLIESANILLLDK